ncbi:MAG: aminoacyl-tRNA hydrolase, partial [Candidatus Colwellbacteria bacterium]|nr:aminoacyl-tRNA hydrolase [Candidatus Colwellbacteria bacterium]
MEIKLAIGLGNPGPEYRNTYHNVGRLFIDHLASERANFKRRSSFEYFQLTNLLTLVKPLTFMNQSGGATLNARKYFNSKPREILVVHDDSDLPLGSFKLSFGRGSA